MPRKKSAAKKAREAAAKEAREVPPPSKVQHVEPLSDSHSDTDSSTEEEDDFGDLVTNGVEQGINEVLDAIKNNNTKKLLDPNVQFFNNETINKEQSRAIEKNKQNREKPMYLKDYHRLNILSGNALLSDDDDDEEGTVDGKPSFVTQQRHERNALLNEINNAVEEDEDEDFLKKKEQKKEENNVVTAQLDGDDFLDNFMSKQAWIPQSGDKIIDLDNHNEDDNEFENAVEDFENAYNFRYEDPNSAEIISYARNQATLRRSQTNSRRKKREEKRQERQSIKLETEAKIQKKKVKKVNKLSDVLEQLQNEFGTTFNDQTINKITTTLMNSDYKENEWDNVIQELCNDEEYLDDTKKPTWNDEEPIEEQEQEQEHVEKHPVKHTSKREKKKLTQLVENAVEANKLNIVDEVENDQRGRSREKDLDQDSLKFRYREVSPESYGLTTREIFAADDTDLNDFISLKKFAPYRAKELRNKDKRKVTKSKRIKEWRKKTFNDENGPSFDGVWLPKNDDSKKKHHHHKKDHHKKNHHHKK